MLALLSLDLSQLRSQGVISFIQLIDLILEDGYVVGHFLVLLRVLETTAAIWRVDALEIQVPTSLAWRLPVAFNFASLAFVACDGYIAVSSRALLWLSTIVAGLALESIRAITLLFLRCLLQLLGETCDLRYVDVGSGRHVW